MSDATRGPRAAAVLAPLAFTAALAALSLLPDAAGNATLRWTLPAAALALAGWHALLAWLRPAVRVLVALRPQHYVQACAQGAILLYWGWYWREVYDSAHLLLAQLLFAYAFDLLLSWTRRGAYTLGFGPFPVIFSINLFLWFKPDWFYLQFLLIALGFAAKELIRWEKDGRRVHIFNPSSFPLGLFSLGLILTGATGLTWGQEIATTLNRAPQIYLFIFLVSLPGQILFGVAGMTMAAAVTMYVFGLLWFAAAGTYYFVDAYIPIAVFLGMHLLFTDPSTAPRTEPGRLAFGVLYALGVIALYGLLGAWGHPRFYDKLLAVPVMNLLIQLLDRAGRSALVARIDPAALWRGLAGRARNLGYVGAWTAAFVLMSAAGGVGDAHRGAEVTFWLARLRGRPAERLPALRRARHRLLQPGLRLGVQRVRHPAAAGSPAGAGGAGVPPRLRQRLRHRLCESGRNRTRRSGARGADAGRLRDSGPGRAPGAARRPAAAGDLPARVRAGLRRRLPAGCRIDGAAPQTPAGRLRGCSSSPFLNRDAAA